MADTDTKGTKEVPTLAEARDEISAYLKGLSLAPIAVALLDAVGERGGEPFGVGEAMKLAGSEDFDGNVLAALLHLVQGDRPPLTKFMVFVDDKGTRHRLDGPIGQGAANGKLLHPVTGEIVPDPEKSTYLMFEPRPGLLREHVTAPTP